MADLLDELEFSRGRTVRDKINKDWSERMSSYRASSAVRNYDDLAEAEEGLGDIEYRRGRTTTRTAGRGERATSVFPANLRHFENLGSLDEEYSTSNEGLRRARRALSEARVLARDISRAASVERESSSYSAVEKSRMRSSALEQSSSLSQQQSQLGNYKITVTPKFETWSSYPGHHFSSSRSTTAALLEKYNPTQFPDFIFGTYGPGNSLNEPISSSLKYYNRSLLDSDIGNSLDTTQLSKYSSNRSSALKRSSYDYDLDSSAANDYYDSSSSKSNYKKSAGALTYQSLDSRSAKEAKDSASMSFYDGMAKSYGLNLEGGSTSTAVALRGRQSLGRRSKDFEPDEVAKAYFEQYGVNLEDKSKKYFDDEEDLSFSASGAGKGRELSQFDRCPSLARTGYNDDGRLILPGTGPGTKAFRIGDKYYDYNTESRVSVPSTTSKFYHYYIPKHYKATPMLGGYMVPAGSRGSKYGWKY